VRVVPMTLRAVFARPYRGGVGPHDVAAQVELESKFEAQLKAVLSYVSFKRLLSGGFNAGLIGSTCTTPP
jgi:hypothetical protein